MRLAQLAELTGDGAAFEVSTSMAADILEVAAAEVRRRTTEALVARQMPRLTLRQPDAVARYGVELIAGMPTRLRDAILLGEDFSVDALLGRTREQGLRIGLGIIVPFNIAHSAAEARRQGFWSAAGLVQYLNREHWLTNVMVEPGFALQIVGDGDTVIINLPSEFVLGVTGIESVARGTFEHAVRTTILAGEITASVLVVSAMQLAFVKALREPWMNLRGNSPIVRSATLELVDLLGLIDMTTDADLERWIDNVVPTMRKIGHLRGQQRRVPR